eukprot:CAMPEP_0172539166 /NCGR_PEP_ID=MMETSP1067-20121228/10414_1 /TAXON_ID=265564 ORGANISM="Thalassiosira punctigera, Strain Tpunct2005C2" /NCGR_SAMPLE_ID=MMETSP1067 /ASSEMBLY_ACC=CAM_ASM_000444 /LENGTH=399 /DNA_ID=CAMNT_0013324805 /DNA_START=276 /DNA_END=1475 /DNA_ORIENTATION=+
MRMSYNTSMTTTTTNPSSAPASSPRGNEEQIFNYSPEGPESFLLMLSSQDNEDPNDAANFGQYFAVGDSARDHADSQNSEFLESMLADSGVSDMSGDFDRMFLAESNRTTESVPMECNIMPVAFGPGQAQEGDAEQLNDNNNGSKNKVRRRRRRSGRSSPIKKCAQLRDVNFDPAPPSGLTRSLTSLDPHRQQRRVPLDAGVARSLTGLGQLKQEISYEEALQNLAESIKRTEQSRQQLMTHRDLIAAAASTQQPGQVAVSMEPLQQQPSQHVISPPQPPKHGAVLSQQLSQHVVSPAQQELFQHAITPPSQHVIASAQQPSQSIVSPLQQPFQQELRDIAAPTLSTRPPSTQCLSDDRLSITAAFFSGSRETLTTGLEQSRFQLKAYMDQMMANNSTF